jgi:hypothetical protein
MIVYLLIDGRDFIPFAEKWRVFSTPEACLEAARELGFGKSPFGEWGNLDTPGRALMERCGKLDVTLIPIEVSTPVPQPEPLPV